MGKKTASTRIPVSVAALLVIVVVALVVLLPFDGLARAAASPAINEYPVHSGEPARIIAGPDGNMWFSGASHNIGKISMSGEITEYPLGENASSSGICVGPDGNLWVTMWNAENGANLARVTTYGVVTYYASSNPGSKPGDICAGPDRNLWFTDEGNNSIGKIDPSTGQIAEYAIPYSDGYPVAITIGTDGNIWFGCLYCSWIGKMTTSGAFTKYSLPTAYDGLGGICVGPDGNIWFTETGYWVGRTHSYQGSNNVGKITMSGTATEYAIPSYGSVARTICAGPDGNLWFIEWSSANLAKIDPESGLITEYALDSRPNGVSAGPDGNMWFTGSVYTSTGDSNGIIGELLLNPPVPQPSQWKSTFYFAEGYTGPNFQEYACLENTDSTVADTWITCMFANGTSKSQYYSLAPASRLTVDINQLVGAGKELSMRVVSTSPGIVAERPMYFNYNGVWTGGSDVVGAAAPSTAFYFAEGTCRPNFDPYLCIQNPGNTEANVTVTYMKGDGTTTAQSVTVAANARATVHPSDVLGAGNDASHDFSTKVTCSQPIVAERPMYFNYNGVWTGGSDVVGAAAPSTAFYFAEGTCRPNFDPYLCIQNPGSTEANVTVTYMMGDGTTTTQNVSVAAYARATVHPSDVLGAGNDASHDFSTKVTCSQPIVAERPMYFNYNGVWTGGSDVVGAAAPSTAFYFAEGTCRPNFDPYLCIQNPGNTEANVTVTYMMGDGTTTTQNVSVAAYARATVHPSDVLGAGNDASHDFSTKVTCSQPIVAERPMYFNYNGVWTGGSDVVGYQK